MLRRGPVALVLAGVLALGGCGGDDDDAASAPDVVEATVEAGAADLEAEGSGSSIASDDSGDATVDRPAPDGAFDIGVVGRDVIIEMHVVLSSDDIRGTVASVVANAVALGGGVASSDVNYGDDDGSGSDGYAVLVVQVPPESVDPLLSGLGDTGTIRSIDQSARDVTEQLIDLDVRIENARRSVTSVREFMERTENLSELVTLEGELTRRQTDLEQLEAQQRNLSDRVALSTVTIDVVPTASVPEPVDDGGDGIGDALRSGWDAFTAMFIGIAIVLATTLPFVIAGLLLALIAWMVVRRGGHRDGGRPRTHRSEPTETATGAAVSEAADEPEPEPVG